MMELINNTLLAFEKIFGHQPTVKVRAPGRVNLIGEHTDYNDGFVLPCAINYQAIALASKRDDNIVRVLSVDYGDVVDQFSLDDDIVQSPNGWANYVRGVVKYLITNGFALRGADIAISGNVPQGAGLSSSAALEVVIGQCFKELCNLDVSSQKIALIGQEAENKFVGCNCGIMDQLISAQGEVKHALLIDCRSLETKAVSLPNDVAVLIVNSNKKRGLVDSEYNTRREQCEQAAAYFNVPALRDVTIERFNQESADLDPIASKRARHVITENQRTVDAAAAMQSGDMNTLQRLMAESHASMRDDFEITVREIDILVDIIKDQLGELGGVRMTGGGFGGCVVALVPTHLIDGVVSAVEEQYQQQTSLEPSIFICTAQNGAGVINE